jgi:hypothetical protein
MFLKGEVGSTQREPDLSITMYKSNDLPACANSEPGLTALSACVDSCPARLVWSGFVSLSEDVKLPLEHDVIKEILITARLLKAVESVLFISSPFYGKHIIISAVQRMRFKQ